MKSFSEFPKLAIASIGHGPIRCMYRVYLCVDHLTCDVSLDFLKAGAIFPPCQIFYTWTGKKNIFFSFPLKVLWYNIDTAVNIFIFLPIIVNSLRDQPINNLFWPNSGSLPTHRLENTGNVNSMNIIILYTIILLNSEHYNTHDA